MPNLLEIIAGQQAAIRDAFADQPEAIQNAIRDIDRIEGDLATTGDEASALERLEALLLSLPQTRRLFRELADGSETRLNPRDHAKVADVAAALRMIRNTFVQAKPASKKEVAAAKLNTPEPTPDKKTVKP